MADLESKTNSREYLTVLPKYRAVSWPLLCWRMQEKARRMWLKLRPHDDYEWSRYHIGYKAEFDWFKRYFTMNLGNVDFRLIEGRLYLLGDCKPVHPAHRCVWEAIYNLPNISSVAEIGTGAGYHLLSLSALLGQAVRLSGYDVSEGQLRFFRSLWPDCTERIKTCVLDLTLGPIPEADRPDIVFASTVLMHIQRPVEYHAALRNFLISANGFAVLMENWSRHDYFNDLAAMTRADGGFEGCQTYFYDSGANIAIVISLKGVQLDYPYQLLTHPAMLEKYY